MGSRAGVSLAFSLGLLACGSSSGDGDGGGTDGTSGMSASGTGAATGTPSGATGDATAVTEDGSTSGGETSADSGAESSTGEPLPPDPQAPDWVATLPVGQWQPISENTMADVDPEDDPAVNPNFSDNNGDGVSDSNAPWHGASGQSCVLACWNGGAFATGYGVSGALLVYGGGHAGYRGSEVYAFDMATRLWERVTDPYPGDDFNVSTGVYGDGSPLPPHTYDGVAYHPETNSFAVLRGINDNASGTLQANIRIAYLLDLDTRQWRTSPFNDDGANLHGGSTAYDPNRGVLWEVGCYDTALTAFDPSGDNGDGTFGSYQNHAAAPTNIDNGAAVDPLRDLLVYTGFRSGEQVSVRFLDDPDRERMVTEQSGDIPAKRGQNGWEWSANLEGFVYWSLGTADVYVLTKDSDDREDPNWTWTNLTDPGNTQMPENTSNDTGPYSRFQVAEYGATSVAVVVNNVDAPVWAFRLN